MTQYEQPIGNSGEENLPFKTWGGKETKQKHHLQLGGVRRGSRDKRHTVEESENPCVFGYWRHTLFSLSYFDLQFYSCSLKKCLRSSSSLKSHL